MMRQHKTPCNECPFRRESPRGYLGGNSPQRFAFLANHDGDFECHKTTNKVIPAQCAGRATMWANQCKSSRYNYVPKLDKNRDDVFSHIGEFMNHHKISLTPLQLMGVEDLYDEEFEEEN
jgi:hypothetical protein